LYEAFRDAKEHPTKTGCAEVGKRQKHFANKSKPRYSSPMGKKAEREAAAADARGRGAPSRAFTRRGKKGLSSDLREFVSENP